MWTAGENVADLELLRRIADEDGLETVNGRFPASVTALMAEGLIKESAAGPGGYVCWQITERGLDRLAKQLTAEAVAEARHTMKRVSEETGEPIALHPTHWRFPGTSPQS